MKKKINVAVLGTGNIGTDLLLKIFKSKYLNCILFSGRSYSSPGLIKFKKILSKKITKKKYNNLITSDKSIKALKDRSQEFDIIFDCTSAKFHNQNKIIFRN